MNKRDVDGGTLYVMSEPGMPPQKVLVVDTMHLYMESPSVKVRVLPVEGQTGAGPVIEVFAAWLEPI